MKTNSIQWIVQCNLINEKVLAEFRSAFSALGVAAKEVVVIPFSSELPDFDSVELNIFYGSTTLMLNAYGSLVHRKGVFYDPARFNTAVYQLEWGERMLNGDGKVLPFQDFIKREVEQKGEWFIRPNEDDKSFAGTVMSSEEIKTWFKQVQGIDNPLLNPRTLVFVAGVKPIRREWRNFVVGGKVVSSSRYMLKGELNVSVDDVPKEMIWFTEDSAAVYAPHQIFVMDIAETEAGFSIIECNCFNGTGFYQHNIQTIVEAVTTYGKEMLVGK